VHALNRRFFQYAISCTIAACDTGIGVNLPDGISLFELADQEARQSSKAGYTSGPKTIFEKMASANIVLIFAHHPFSLKVVLLIKPGADHTAQKSRSHCKFHY
jgi:hypothetical protein